MPLRIYPSPTSVLLLVFRTNPIVAGFQQSRFDCTLRTSPDRIVRENNCSRLRANLTHHHLDYDDVSCTPHSFDHQTPSHHEADTFDSSYRSAGGDTDRRSWRSDAEWFLRPLHRTHSNLSPRTAQEVHRDVSTPAMPVHSKWDELLSQTSSVKTLSTVDRRPMWEGYNRMEAVNDSSLLDRSPAQPDILYTPATPKRPWSPKLSKDIPRSLNSCEAEEEVISPYTQRIVELRLEGLKLEESQILESKRQQELEFWSGPTPGWHSLKTSQFHTEARRNNDILRRGLDTQEQLEYLKELTAAEFR